MSQAANETYVIGDKGIQFRVTMTVRNSATNALTPLDLTPFVGQTLQMEFLKTDGTLIPKTASIVGAPTAGVLEYLSEADLATTGDHGTWHRRGRVENVGTTITGKNWIEFTVVESGVAVANILRIKRHLPAIDGSEVSNDTHLEDYWKSMKHYYDNARSLYTDVPLVDYPEEIIDLFERGAAAWWIYWNSPDHQMQGIKELKKEMEQSLRAEFEKKHGALSGRTAAPKTSSKITGFR